MIKAFFWLFKPSGYEDIWHNYMSIGLALAIGYTLLALVIYHYLLPYNRNKEIMKLWIVFFSALAASVITFYLICRNIPEDIIQAGELLSFIIHYTISNLVLLYIVFLFSAYILPSSKKYFPRILAVFRIFK